MTATGEFDTLIWLDVKWRFLRGLCPCRDAKSRSSSPQAGKSGGERYRRLPTGAHGIDPEEVKRDQRERLQSAIVELIAERGYQAVRILDLTKLARVSRPTFYSLYDDKEELFLAAYDEIAQRTAKTVIAAYEVRTRRTSRTGACRRRSAPSPSWRRPRRRRCR